jgi:hypothetical protein
MAKGWEDVSIEDVGDKTVEAARALHPELCPSVGGIFDPGCAAHTKPKLSESFDQYAERVQNAHDKPKTARAFKFTPPPEPREGQEQAVLIQRVKLHLSVYPCLSMLFAIPNGGTRIPKEMVIMLRQGVSPGVPDLCLPVARNEMRWNECGTNGCGIKLEPAFHSLWIELKRRNSGEPSEKQADWLRALRAQGHCAVWCRGADEAWEVLEAYVSGMPLPPSRPLPVAKGG